MLAATALIAVGVADARGPVRPLAVWGGPGAAPGRFAVPDGVAVDAAGHVYVADRDNHRIQTFTAGGRLLAVWGGVAGRAPGQLSDPYGVAADGFGNVYVADTDNNRIVKFTAAGRFLAAWGAAGGTGAPGAGDGEFNDPRGVAVDDRGDVYVADHGNNRIQKLSPAGRFLARFGAHGGDGTAGAGDGEFNRPRGVAIDHDGNIFVADKINNRIQELDRHGRFVRRWGAFGGNGTPGLDRGQFNVPYNIAITPDGHVFVSDVGNNRIQEFSPTGRWLAAYGRNGGDGSAGTAPGEFDQPYGIAADCRGDLYVTEEDNNRLQKLGVPGRPPPRCPPALTVSVSAGRRAVALRALGATVACDRPCTARVGVLVTGTGMRAPVRAASARRDVVPGRAVRRRVALSAPAARTLRAAIARGTRLRGAVTVTARGLAGAARPVRRSVRLAP